MSLHKVHIVSTLFSLIFFISDEALAKTDTSAFSIEKPHLYVLVHGTWASPRHWLLHGGGPQWHQRGHESFDTLKKESRALIISHAWSGKNNLADRIEGAQTLVIELKQLAVSHTIHIIAHSHGGNVALLALETLAQEQSDIRIKELILLGTPIHLDWYKNCFGIAHKIYNIFSYGDIIQSVAGMYERLLPEHDHIFNIQIKMNDACPTHNRLYTKEIMKQIPHLHKLFAKKDVYCLHCKDGQKPVITQDTNRETDILKDKQFTQQLLESWADIRERYASETQNNNDRLTRLRDRWSKHYQKTVTRLYDALNTNQA